MGLVEGAIVKVLSKTSRNMEILVQGNARIAVSNDFAKNIIVV